MTTTLINQNTSTFENHLPILKFGVCSWTDSTLIACERFYPKTIKTTSERLAFYSTQFPCVEVDSSNYAIPPPHRVEKWVKETPKNFKFLFKAFGMFTLGRVDDVAKLPWKVKQSLPVVSGAVTWDQLSPISRALLWEAWNDCLQPAIRSEKIAAVLFQFHGSFHCTQESKDYILACRQCLDPKVPMAVEFCSLDWLNQQNREETIKWLKDHNLALVAVDEKIRLSLEFKKQIQKEKKLQKNLEPKENNTTNEIKEPISNTNSNDNQKVTVQTAVGVISKQQLKVPPISPNKKRTEEMIVTEYFIEEDDKEIPYRYPEVVLTKTAPDFAYIRIHRREGLDRTLTDEELRGWVDRLEKFCDEFSEEFKKRNEPFIIYFLWNTNQEDQSMQNCRRLISMLNEKLNHNKLIVCDWQNEIEKEKRFSGIKGYFKTTSNSNSKSSPHSSPGKVLTNNNNKNLTSEPKTTTTNTTTAEHSSNDKQSLNSNVLPKTESIVIEDDEVQVSGSSAKRKSPPSTSSPQKTKKQKIVATTNINQTQISSFFKKLQ